MARKIIYTIILIATQMLLFGCDNDSQTVYFYQFQDTADCDYCVPAYCFYYNKDFHYTAVNYGFYENDYGFLRDSLYFTFMRDSISAVKILETHSGDDFDSIKCYFEYPSHWRFTFEMNITRQGICELFLYSPFNKKGLYTFGLTLPECCLVRYSVSQLLTKDTGLYMSFNKRSNFVGDPVCFLIKVYQGGKGYSYAGDQDADNVPDELFFFRDAMGAIAQNHFSKLNPHSDSTFHTTISDELSRILFAANQHSDAR